MRFIAKHILAPDERLVYATRLHGIYLFVGFVWAAIFIGAGLAINWAMVRTAGAEAHTFRVNIMNYDLGPAYFWIVGAFFATGIGLFLIHLIKVWFTEVALTTTRLIYKTGWIVVDVEEIALTEIEAEKIHHGILGSILGYGAIHLDCRFVDDFNLPSIRNPYRFLRILHKTRTQQTAAHPAAPVVV